MSDAALTPVPDPPASRGAALALAVAAIDDLADLGETIEDEWTYVTTLAEAGRTRLRAAAGPQVAAPMDRESADAVVAACAEAARITDPHRAIDWLSTLPAVVELVLVPAGPSDTPGPSGDTGPAGASGAPGPSGGGAAGPAPAGG